MIGVQKQWGNFVVGVEAGVAGLLNSGFSSTSGDGTATTICVSAAPAVCQMRLSNPITMVGGKLGFASNDWLFYGVAGGAWSKINSRFVNAAGVVFDNAGGSLNGYYVGLGVNYAWIKSQSLDVIFGLEYRHVDLGKKLFQSSADANINGSNGRRLGARSDMILGTMEVKFNMFR